MREDPLWKWRQWWIRLSPGWWYFYSGIFFVSGIIKFLYDIYIDNVFGYYTIILLLVGILLFIVGLFVSHAKKRRHHSRK